MADVKEIFDQMPGKFKSENASGLNVVYQFDITGDGGGKWLAKIHEGQLDVSEGEDANANVTISASSDDWAAISTGSMNAQMAFMTGKLKIKGDMGLAMKMQSLFSL